MKNWIMKVAVRTSLVYWLLSVIWILFSDRAVLMLSSKPNVIIALSTYKGWAFVTATAILLYIALRNQLDRWQEETEKRKNAEKALHRYELLANHTSDLILFVRLADGRIIEANAAAVRAYGYPREKLLSMSINEVRAPGERGITSAQMAEADKRSILFETIHMRKDGSTFPVEVNSQGIDIDGTRTLISVVRDITWRRDAEVKLRRQEHVLRLFVENSPAAVAMLDRDMKYIVASRRFLADYRLGEQNVVGRSHYEIFPDIPDRWKEIHRRCLAGNIEKCDEDPFPREDGSTDWVKWEIHPWYEEAGHIGGIILFTEVITGRKREAEELQMSRMRLLGLINTAMDGIISLDENQKIILFNSAAETMFGVSAEEMIGKPLDTLIPERFREKHHGLITEFGRAGKTNAMGEMAGMRVVSGLRANGEEFPMEASISQIEVGGKKVYTVIHRDVTEQLKSRQELRESEEKFRTLYENSTVGIYRTTPDGKIILANPALVKMLGYSSLDELSARNLETTGFEPSYSRAEFLKIIEEKGEVKGLESAWTRRDGTTLYLRESARAIRSADGRTLYYDGVVEDITDRKRAEEQLLIKNSAIESSISAIGLADMNGRVFYVNEAFARLWGYDNAGELIGKNISTFSMSSEKLRDAVTSMMRGNGYRAESKGIRKDGTTFDFEISTNVVKSERGDSLCLMASFIDITERKSAEKKLTSMYEELKSSEEKYRSLFEQSKDAIFMSRTDGSLIDINLAGVELLGFDSKDELLGINMADFFVSPEDVKSLFDVLQRDRFVKDREFTFKKKNGEQIMVSSTASFALDEFKQAFSVLGIVRDITKQKTLQQQLMQAQRMESVGTFASGIAHDFNNILGIVLGHVGLLGEAGDGSGKLSQSVKAIEKAAVRGASLVRQLLTFARKGEPVYEHVQINDVVNEVTKLLKETMPKTIDVVTDLKQDLPYLDADATQIHQILLNLCLNAKDAMPRGGTVKIVTSISEGEAVVSKFPSASLKEYILLNVSDTGIGMDEETKRRIYDPFFTTKEVGKGTGLGLALTHSIVTDHGGYIDVETQPGKGTTFSIYLPISDQITEENPAPELSMQDASGGTETILLIEDEEMLRELITAVIESKGYSVLTAADGEDGVDLFTRRQSEIAVVISDLGLPKLSGDEVLRRIRSINPSARFIAASGFIEPNVKSKLLEIGVTHFVQKPYLLAEILQTIREVIDEKK